MRIGVWHISPDNYLKAKHELTRFFCTSETKLSFQNYQWNFALQVVVKEFHQYFTPLGYWLDRRLHCWAIGAILFWCSLPDLRSRF